MLYYHQAGAIGSHQKPQKQYTMNHMRGTSPAHGQRKEGSTMTNTQENKATTTTTTTTEQTNTIRTTRKGLTDHNSATFTARATQAVAFESKEHMRIAYGELVNVWAIPHGTPVDVEGQEAATFIPESVAKVLPLRFLVKARPSISTDVQELERILFNPATSTTAAAKAFVAFVERNNGNESAPYAEQAGRFLYKSSVKPVLKNGQGAIRSCLNSVLPYFLFMAFTGVNVVKNGKVSKL